MLRMDMVFVIRHKVLVERRSIRSVARELGVSRNTVSKYLQTSEPARKPSVPRPRPVMDKVAQHIDKILSQWARRLTPKQRLTGSRLHRHSGRDFTWLYDSCDQLSFLDGHVRATGIVLGGQVMSHIGLEPVTH